MKDNSKLEIDTQKIQDFYNGKSVNLADIEAFVSDQAINDDSHRTNQASQQNIVNNQGFYVPQYEYIEYEIAKREAIKKSLRRKRRNYYLWIAFLWLLKVIFSVVVLCLVCSIFYQANWLLQKTF